MTASLRSQLQPAIVVLLLLTLVTGVAYPVAITAIAQLLFPHQANGSLIVANGQTVGSTLIGQAVDDPKYFWGRLSAAGDGYDGMASAGSNLSTSNQDLIDRVNKTVAQYRGANGDAPVPVDLITTSASGLDPDISPEGAEYQVARVAAARGIGEDDVRAAVVRHTEGRLFGFLGQPRVHVLELNLDLDGLLP